MTKDQYASSPGNRAYCYAELAVPSLVVAKTNISTHCTYPRSTARLSWPGWLVTDQKWSPIPVLIGFNIRYAQRCYHHTKLPHCARYYHFLTK